jgi:hypothetical protein
MSANVYTFALRTKHPLFNCSTVYIETEYLYRSEIYDLLFSKRLRQNEIGEINENLSMSFATMRFTMTRFAPALHFTSLHFTSLDFISQHYTRDAKTAVIAKPISVR